MPVDTALVPPDLERAALVRPAPTLVTARCAACGATFRVRPGETADAARDRHSLSPDCDAAERRAAFEGTLYGRGVDDGSQEYDPDEY